MKALICKWCGANYSRRPCEADKSKFCSRVCQLESKKVIISPPTDRKMEIINGALLSDGSIENSKKSNYHFCETHCLADKEYVEWMSAELGDWVSSINDGFSNYNGKKYLKSRLACHNHVMWNELRQKWYPNGIKIVPKDLQLTPLTLACWHCGDGTNDPKTGVIELLTCGFTLDDVEFLRAELYKLDIDTTIKFDRRFKKPYPIIYVRSISYLPFMELVKPHIVCDCMQRKVTMSDWVKNHRRFRRWATFVFEDGTIHRVDNIAKFARNHNVNVDGLYSLVFKRTKNYKGWTIP